SLAIPVKPGQKEVSLFLVAGDAGDGNVHDFAIWQRPRLVVPGRADLLLRDVRDLTRDLAARREKLIASTAKSLQAAADLAQATEETDIAAVAKQRGIDPDSLAAWFNFLGVHRDAKAKLNLFATKLTSVAKHDFVQGWGSTDTPLVIANSSANAVRIPGSI